ncbi:MAG: SRPBCC domain-containing protein [Myxococcota bacterium]
MVDIVHRIGMRAPLEKVFAAIATVDGVAGWWTRLTTGESSVGGKMNFGFTTPAGEPIGQFQMTVVERTPDQRVRWRVNDGPADWIGTEVDFSLSRQGDQTVLLFGHRHWREAGESMAHCNMKWATFLLSLRDLVESGKGRPAPDDLKIDNWN